MVNKCKEMKKEHQTGMNELDWRINRARLAGAMHGYTPAEFRNYLLEVGLNKYEKVILPIENGRSIPQGNLPQDIKVIPFPTA